MPRHKENIVYLLERNPHGLYGFEFYVNEYDLKSGDQVELIKTNDFNTLMMKIDIMGLKTVKPIHLEDLPKFGAWDLREV